MIHLTLVRHGETDWNQERRYQGQTDTPLNAAGRQQAERLARRLAGSAQSGGASPPIDVIYASDLKRAWETAAVASAALGVAAHADPRLREMAFGSLEGMTFAEAQARHPEMTTAWLADREEPFPGGEPYSAFSARVARFLDDVQRDHQGQRVLVVAHGGPLKEILRLALAMPPDGKWAFQIDNASISELLLYDGSPVLALLNDTHHLG